MDTDEADGDSVNKSDPYRPKIWDTFLKRYGLVIGPALGYYLAYKYEANYCGAFGIPGFLIEIDLKTILLFCSSTTALLGGFVYLYFIGIAFATHLRPTAGRTIRIYLPWLVISIFLVLAYRNDIGRAMWIVILFAALSVADFVRTWIVAHRSKAPFWPKLQGPFPYLVDAERPIVNSTRDAIVIVVLFALMSTAAATILGGAAAINQQQFLVLADDPSAIVIRRYGDRLLCCRVDFETKMPGSVFFASTQSSDGPLHMELSDVGPLRPVP